MRVGPRLGVVLLVVAWLGATTVQSAPVSHAAVAGLNMAPKRLDQVGSVLPNFMARTLPGHVVGVLQWDPNTPQPHSKPIFLAHDRVWTNLYVPRPPGTHAPDTLVVSPSKNLVVPTGVQVMGGTDVHGDLPALVSVQVNQGQGVSGANGFLFKAQPSSVAAWRWPLAPIVSACVEDWGKLAVQFPPADHQDLVYVTYDDVHNHLGVIILRRQNRAVEHTRDLRAPIVIRLGKPFAVVRYDIDATPKLIDKILAIQPANVRKD